MSAPTDVSHRVVRFEMVVGFARAGNKGFAPTARHYQHILAGSRESTERRRLHSSSQNKKETEKDAVENDSASGDLVVQATEQLDCEGLSQLPVTYGSLKLFPLVTITFAHLETTVVYRWTLPAPSHC